ncbi:MAG: hypothetical protein UV53_C0014G0004 [Candidatus Azambacteria bacterium GW2011_GWE1_42_9]|nr:MAG: hypothetical protein UU33_C0001G0122 [Candidatus Azambacteria bacterium GW2011_GWF1_41_10]KKS49105.1 MAG: hypothetical protein UV14_C0002G0102 [Candidatus Azambacteria bacterium GW2011_GWF2_42_22]KKS79128.1 MAG: hypothetical protein UV53_C0014G0004 [Candidatus Azambacteria bacterium GW2011_GWE1_42_9]KKT03315.1 MAG: hypothetical protein UV81_C0002G0068 [Candidatus Azambacteria bacterium GW2011_GWD1_43_18]KKT12608.1 MAG: hypothetical protein UV93_C0002G0006 [Candidatus Azambacteria bacter
MPSSRYYRFKTHSEAQTYQKKKTVFFWIFGILILIGMIWFFLISSVFRIVTIKLSENNVVSNADVRQVIANNTSFNLDENFFILSKNNIKTKLAAAFPILTDINIEKRPFQTLIINFEKRIPIGIWCHPTGDHPKGDNCFYLDKEGIVFQETPQTEGSLILKVEDAGKNIVALGERVLNEKQLNFITTFNNKAAENNKIQVIEFKMASSTNSSNIEAITNYGWSIYLDQNQDPALAANNLSAILNETIKGKFSTLRYIDLRIPSRVFYNLK